MTHTQKEKRVCCVQSYAAAEDHTPQPNTVTLTISNPFLASKSIGVEYTPITFLTSPAGRSIFATAFAMLQLLNLYCEHKKDLDQVRGF